MTKLHVLKGCTPSQKNCMLTITALSVRAADYIKQGRTEAPSTLVGALAKRVSLREA